MKNAAYTITAIFFCLLVGKLFNYVVGGLPASLYGMILFCLFLKVGWFSPVKIHKANQWIIKNMGVCFIPAAVGVINHFDLIKIHGFTIVSIILVTTFMLITIVGYLAEKYLLAKPNQSSVAREN